MAQFVQEYAALRWAMVAAFLVASAIVVARVTAFAVSLPGPFDHPAEAGTHSSRPHAAGHSESDAAHLVMCSVMLGMLLFPSGANPHMLHGVLIAMVVVFSGLLVARAAEHVAQGRSLPIGQVVPLGYHTVAAAAMLYAMSGHAGGHAGGPAAGPALGLTAFFLLDAVFVAIAARFAATRGSARGALGSLIRCGGYVAACTGPVRTREVLPHLVMDMGSAYMLVAAVFG
ncbi:DUF5134 domain-containing protein [Nocardia sp. 004]|uniref:DUF5134 domain-containing protein n=1 Tax=Nocardia sp. 004 TaxID=3385978 RepID=UPI0039A0C4C9